jgi:anti-sigma B factor antagonist
MKVVVREIETALIINLEGKMMLGSEQDDFQNAVKSGVEKNKKDIVVDLSQVNFISSWGIGVLIHGYTTSVKAGKSFKLASVPDRVKEVFNKVKLHTIFSQYGSVDEALKN